MRSNGRKVRVHSTTIPPHILLHTLTRNSTNPAPAPRRRTTPTTLTRIRSVLTPVPALCSLLSDVLRGVVAERAELGPLHHRGHVPGDLQGLFAVDLGEWPPSGAERSDRRLTPHHSSYRAGTQTGADTSVPRLARDPEPAQEEVAREGHVQLDMQPIQELTARPNRAPLFRPPSSVGRVDSAFAPYCLCVAQVQRIKNEFTVTVYEIHARMALEVVCALPPDVPGTSSCPRIVPCAVTLTSGTAWRAQGDMVEYNQCQAMLRNLYELGIPGKVEEFTAYRILMLLHGRNRSGTLFAAYDPLEERADVSI